MKTRVKTSNVCRCCLTVWQFGSFKKISRDHLGNINKQENFAKMLSKTFNFSHCKGYICDSCIAKLRNAATFRELIEHANNEYVGMLAKLRLNCEEAVSSNESCISEDGRDPRPIATQDIPVPAGIPVPVPEDQSIAVSEPFSLAREQTPDSDHEESIAVSEPFSLAREHTPDTDHEQSIAASEAFSPTREQTPDTDYEASESVSFSREQTPDTDYGSNSKSDDKTVIFKKQGVHRPLYPIVVVTDCLSKSDGKTVTIQDQQAHRLTDSIVVNDVSEETSSKPTRAVTQRARKPIFDKNRFREILSDSESDLTDYEGTLYKIGKSVSNNYASDSEDASFGSESSDSADSESSKSSDTSDSEEWTGRKRKRKVKEKPQPKARKIKKTTRESLSDGRVSSSDDSCSSSDTNSSVDIRKWKRIVTKTKHSKHVKKPKDIAKSKSKDKERNGIDSSTKDKITSKASSGKAVENAEQEIAKTNCKVNGPKSNESSTKDKITSKPSSGDAVKKTGQVTTTPEAEKEKNRELRANTLKLVSNSNICLFKSLRTRFACYICSENFDEIISLRKHTSDHSMHLIVKKIKSLHGKTFQCAEITKLKCTKCSQPCRDIPALKYHLSEKHEFLFGNGDHLLVPYKLEKGFKCTICKDKFKSFTRLSIHMNSHSLNVMCTVCGMAFFNKRNLSTHVRSLHRGHSCQFCSKTFPTSAKMSTHLVKEHNTTAPKHYCPKCDKHFPFTTMLKNHLVDKHGATHKSATCKKCGKVVKNALYLKTHMRSVHKRERNFPCPLCSLKFFTKTDLIRHRAAHEEGTFFACDICGSNYKFLDSARTHMKTHHSKFLKQQAKIKKKKK